MENNYKSVTMALFEHINIDFNIKDEYDENRLLKLSIVFKYAIEVANALHLDSDIVAGMIYGDELTRLTEGMLSVCHVSDDDISADKVDCAKNILRDHLNESDPVKVAAIMDGMDRLISRNDHTAEEKLAFMMIDGFDYAECLDTESKRKVALINFKNMIMVNSKKYHELAGPKLPHLENPRPKVRTIENRVIVRSAEEAFDYVMDHYYAPGYEAYAPRYDTYAVISIQDTHTGGFGFKFCENELCEGVLTLYFDDVVREVHNAVLFNEEQAKKIIDFLETAPEVDTLLIHCYGGQSRSRAVGAFAVRYFGGDNSRYFSEGNPNMHVYETLLKAADQK